MKNNLAGRIVEKGKQKLVPRVFSNLTTRKAARKLRRGKVDKDISDDIKEINKAIEKGDEAKVLKVLIELKKHVLEKEHYIHVINLNEERLLTTVVEKTVDMDKAIATVLPLLNTQKDPYAQEELKNLKIEIGLLDKLITDVSKTLNDAISGYDVIVLMNEFKNRNVFLSDERQIIRNLRKQRREDRKRRRQEKKVNTAIEQLVKHKEKTTENEINKFLKEHRKEIKILAREVEYFRKVFVINTYNLLTLLNFERKDLGKIIANLQEYKFRKMDEINKIKESLEQNIHNDLQVELQKMQDLLRLIRSESKKIAA